MNPHFTAVLSMIQVFKLEAQTNLFLKSLSVILLRYNNVQNQTNYQALTIFTLLFAKL